MPVDNEYSGYNLEGERSVWVHFKMVIDIFVKLMIILHFLIGKNDESLCYIHGIYSSTHKYCRMYQRTTQWYTRCENYWPIQMPNCKKGRAPIDILAGLKRYPKGVAHLYVPQQCEIRTPPPTGVAHQHVHTYKLVELKTKLQTFIIWSKTQFCTSWFCFRVEKTENVSQIRCSALIYYIRV